MENGKLRCAVGAVFYFPLLFFAGIFFVTREFWEFKEFKEKENFEFSIPFLLFLLFLLFYRPHPPSALLGEAAERNYDHPSLTSPVVGEVKSFSPELGEMVHSTREVC